MVDIPVIAIDGPSGSGKGAVCSILAKKLQWHVLDSGALYRTLAFAALNNDINLDDQVLLSKFAKNLDINFRHNISTDRILVYLGEIDVSTKIRSEKCGNAASKIAPYNGVRRALLRRQHEFLQSPGLIADGRDMGTVVFPDAPVKIYLSASLHERVNRRYKQLKEQGFSVNLARLSAEITERDGRDKERTHSPLLPHPDAVVIDTTNIKVIQVVEQVLALAKKAFPGLLLQLPIN
ncbi:MAG: cytidylate kinase [Gammaproteobacteria bacterium]|jgi:cytidylate kinase